MFSMQETIIDTPTPSLTNVLRHDFDALFNLSYSIFIKTIQDLIPESLLLKYKANVSAEGVASEKANKNVFGLMEDEEIRAFSGLLRFKDIIRGTEEDYNNFVACQIEMKKPVLSYTSFLKIREYVMATLTSPEDFAAAMWSILCNDLGKVQMLIEVYEASSHKQTLGHDLLLAELLKLRPDMFPAFASLPLQHQTQIISGYASGCDISQFEQLELPAVSLNALQKLDKKTLDLYILHTIFDVSGAAAHFKANGSLTFHEETWAFFNATRQALEKLHSKKNNNAKEVYHHYLQFRGQCVGIEANTSEHIALIRIAGLARLATVEQGKMLVAVWQSLPEETRHILIQELNVNGDKDLRAIFIGYGVAMLLNPQSALQKELTELAKCTGIEANAAQRAMASKEGLKIGLIMMGKVFAQARNCIGFDAKTGIFVAECDAIARFLSKEPRKALNMGFALSNTSERRVDFNLVITSEPKEEIIKKSEADVATSPTFPRLFSTNAVTPTLQTTAQVATNRACV